MSLPWMLLGDGYRIGRIAGIELNVNAGFIPMALLLTAGMIGVTGGLGSALVLVLLFALSILAHELGHALTARSCGIRTRSITLHLLGGVAKIEGEAQRPAHEILIAAAGPAVSFAIAALAQLAFVGFGALGLPGQVVAANLMAANLVLGIFNLLPALPLDGGRILRGILWQAHGDRRRATITAARGGEILGLLFYALAAYRLLTMGLLAAILPAIMGWFLRSAAGAEKERALHEQRAARGPGIRLEDLLTILHQGGTRRPAPQPGPGPGPRAAADEEIIRYPDGRVLYTGRRRKD